MSTGIICLFALSFDLSLNFQLMVGSAKVVASVQNDSFFQEACQTDRRRQKAKWNLIEGRPKAGFNSLVFNINLVFVRGMARISHFEDVSLL